MFPSDGLVARWQGTEGSGSVVVDVSGNGFDMTLSNMTWSGVSVGDGIALNCSRSLNSYGWVAHNAALHPSFMSVSGWMSAGWTNSELGCLVSCSYAGGWYLLKSTTNKMLIRLDIGSTVVYPQCSFDLTTLSAGAHHFVATYDGNYLKLYVDGILVDTDDLTANPDLVFFTFPIPIHYAYNNGLHFGNSAATTASAAPNAGYGLNGQIGDIALWNRALTDAEVAAMYEAAPPIEVNVPAIALPLGWTAPSSSHMQETVPQLQLPIGLGLGSFQVSMPVPAPVMVTLGSAADYAVSATTVVIALPLAVRATSRWSIPEAMAYQSIYQLRVTGQADGLDDTMLPMTNFTASVRTDGRSYLQVSVPFTAELAAALTDRPAGDLVIEAGPRFADGTINLTEIARATSWTVQNDRGTRSGSISLRGWSTYVADAPAAVEILGTMSISEGASKRMQSPRIDFAVRPGDTVLDKTTGLSFVVGMVTYTLTPRTAQMIISEAA